jgi:hypothetical protein
VVNTYYPGIGSAPSGATSLRVGAPRGSSTPIRANDLLVVLQVQDAQFDSSNTLSYGHGGAPAKPAAGYTSLGLSGVYEYVQATSAVVGGLVHFRAGGLDGGLFNPYSSAPATPTRGQRTFEVVRVASYGKATASSALTAAAWDGSTGGVLALDVASTLTLTGTVSVDGLGFRGGAAFQRTGAPGFSSADTAVSATANVDGNKGEGTGLGTALLVGASLLPLGRRRR